MAKIAITKEEYLANCGRLPPPVAMTEEEYMSDYRMIPKIPVIFMKERRMDSQEYGRIYQQQKRDGEVKTCKNNDCRKEIPLICFDREPKSKDGYKSKCKACIKKYMKTRYKGASNTRKL